MAGMYPDNRTESVFGELVEWPGMDPATGKFTNGDFSDPLKKPSFIPADTVNLILDNLASLITALGGTPDNFSVNQLRDAVLGGIGASMFIPAATATLRGGARVPRGNGLAMSGDALGMSVATPQAAGAMSTEDKRRLDAVDLRANKYTFIIDSNAALAAWANNTAGNDYSRILIKAGTWTLNTTLTGGTASNPIAAIDISNRRTMSVVGEVGSVIVINRQVAGPVHVAGIRGEVAGAAPNLTGPSGLQFFDNITIEMGPAINRQGFNRCANLKDCRVTFSTAGSSSDSSLAFTDCTNLIGCAGTDRAAGHTNNMFVNCTNLVNCIGTGGTGFANCTNLTNCIGTGNDAGHGFNICRHVVSCIGSAGGTGAGFSRCRTGLGNRRGGGEGTGGTFDRCLMAQGTGNPTTNDWANTAEGGWNDPSNPGVSSLFATLDMPPDAEDALSKNMEVSERSAESRDTDTAILHSEEKTPVSGRGLP